METEEQPYARSLFYVRSHYETVIGGRGSFRPSGHSMEPQNEAVHIWGQKQDPYSGSAENPEKVS